jgi:outer membrane protein OmpA-like peptidoglycan-associated protein
MHQWLKAVGLVAACGAIPALAIDVSDIKPRPGLVLTSTVYASVHSSSTSFGYLDTEDLFTLDEVTPEALNYQIKMSAPKNQQVEDVARRLKWPRKVRREDLQESTRMTLLYASTDPASYAGQTFAETSTKVMTALKAGSETPFVFGPYSGSPGEGGPLGSPVQSTNVGPSSAAQPSGGAPQVPDMGALLHMAFGSARHYYRGTLHRVEPHDVPVAVLVNGIRTELPAVHAAGSFTFGQEPPVQAEVWWLDNADWPLTLHWIFGPGNSVVTRIDWPADDSASAREMASQLQGKSCRVELHGIYFNSGSAVLLEESDPMLKQVAALIKTSPEATLTIEGHTDNVGSAQYNQTLSEQRAGAVRDALVMRYGIAPVHLSATGYGLTRPVESNTTFEGRAHNRRVELARACGPPK